jgi:trk system potassium uptake protein TrkH
VLSGLLHLRKRTAVVMSAHTKLVLTVSGALIAGAMLAILALEWTNPRTLAPLGFGEKLLAAYFQAVTPRTAGFNTISVGDMTAPALFLTISLMFIGAAPGSTGGGVKVTTFGVIVAAVWATVRGHRDVTVFRRRLAPELVSRAFALSLLAAVGLLVVTGFLLLAEHHALLHTSYEAVSAFGTVGLSMGVAGSPLSLSGFFGSGGKWLIIFLMFVGRVGPLTLAVALAGAAPPARVRYPEGKVLIG